MNLFQLLNVVCASKECLYFIKYKLKCLFCSLGLFYDFVIGTCKFLEPNRHFTWKMDFDGSGSFVIPIDRKC
jgi:hypothetical protein